MPLRAETGISTAGRLTCQRIGRQPGLFTSTGTRSRKSLPEQRNRLELIDSSGGVKQSQVATEAPGRQAFALSGLQVAD
jgi:hypothetical protein